MTRQPASVPLAGGVALLERAINYTLGCLHLVTSTAMSSPTPCWNWDLRALLGHMTDSLAVLGEAADLGHVPLAGPAGDAVTDLVPGLKNRACQLLGAWTNAGELDCVSIAGRSLTGAIVAGTGALEIAVHGWDVAQACGRDRPIPAELAAELLDLAPLLVTQADRPARFGAAIAAPLEAGASDRLLAFLGRRAN
jgi:uncharacterized protein (TIGR03086 family)